MEHTETEKSGSLSSGDSDRDINVKIQVKTDVVKNRAVLLSKDSFDLGNREPFSAGSHGHKSSLNVNIR